MKRIFTKALCLVCAGALVLSLAACGGKADSAASSTASSSALGSASDYDYQNFNYSDGLDEKGYWEGIRALDYVTLPEDFASVAIKRSDVEPTSEEVEEQISNLLSQYSSTEHITDRAAADGDTVDINYVGSVNNVEFTGGSAENYDLTLGSGTFIDGFEDQIIGHKPGETFDVNVTFPDGYSDSTDASGNTVKLSGQKAVFTVTLNYISESVLPELTDSWVADNFGTFGTPNNIYTVEALRALPGVGMVSRNLRGGRMFTLRGEGERSMNVDFIGVDQYFAEVYSLTLVAGRLFNADDMERHRRVCMLGREAARNLYGDPADALGKLLFLEKDVFEVVGVVSGVMLGSWGQGGFLPYTTMMDRNWAGGKVTRLFIRAIGWEDVPPLVRLIPEVVREHQSAPYLVVRTQEEQLERIKTTFMWVEALLWLGIAASLMLGGFGIWYGTFAAVRARTREVGLKKAMGGSDTDILAQFLAEALCKSVAGGILGIVVGVVLVEVGAWSLGTGISYPLLIASSSGSIVFSALIGVAGGLYPALQASRMDVVSALRFE